MSKPVTMKVRIHNLGAAPAIIQGNIDNVEESDADAPLVNTRTLRITDESKLMIGIFGSVWIDVYNIRKQWGDYAYCGTWCDYEDGDPDGRSG